MKSMHMAIIIVLLAIAAAFSFSSFVKPAIGGSPSVIIAKIKNDVKVKPGDMEAWESAKPNQMLAMNDRIKTGEDSFATLKFSYPQENCFNLDQSTEVVVGKIVAGKDVPLKSVNMQMLKGGTWARLKGADKKKFKFTVTTPNTVAAISGTSLATIVYSDVESYFCACDGVIDIGTAGKSVTIKRAEGTTVKGNQAPTPPVSDKDIIYKGKFEKDPRYGWCIRCHQELTKNMSGFARFCDWGVKRGIFPGCCSMACKPTTN